MDEKTKRSEIIVEISEEEYQAELEQGFAEDEVLQPGIYTFRRGSFLTRHGLDPDQTQSSIKVRVTLSLDLDVLNYFRQRAERADPLSYQTQINAALRAVMEQERSAVTAQPEETARR